MKQRPRRFLESTGRERKGKGFETEIQEVLSAIGSAYCSLKRLGNKIGSAYYSLQRLGKHHYKMLTIGREGKRKGFDT